MPPGQMSRVPGLQNEAPASRAPVARTGTLPPDDSTQVTEETDMRSDNRYAQSLAAAVVVLAMVTAGILAGAAASVQAYV